MKNLKLLSFLSLVFLFFSCREDHTEPGYNGNSYLHFNNGVVKSDGVKINTGSKDHIISYGTIKAVTGTHTVKLVVDAANSTAVQGVDYQIIKGTDELTNGETGGNFIIRMKEPASASVTKKIVFKLESATIQNAVFDTTYILNYKLQCLVGDFLSTPDFDYAGYWNGTGQYQIIPVPGATNKLRILDYPEVGHHFDFEYNEEGVVTFEPQFTGYVYSSAPYAGVQVWIKPTSTPSTVDMCSRVLTINAHFILEGPNVGWLNKTEMFTGF